MAEGSDREGVRDAGERRAAETAATEAADGETAATEAAGTTGAADGETAAAGLVDGETVTVARPLAEPDLAAAERAATALLAALGLDVTAPVLAQTPRRLARAYAELFAPRPFQLTTFPNDEGYDELVLVRDIPFTSVCEHHLLPFTGTVTVAYLPGARILGLSKLARTVELFSRRPQVQERMTEQIARFLHDQLDARGVGVIAEAEHTCMTIRGARAVGSSTTTSSLLGCLREDARTRAEFLALASRRG